MEIPKTLHKRIETCAEHVFQGLIPNWVKHGFNAQGYSRESLTLDWQPNLLGRVRLLTQCRQLYTLSQATILGYISGYENTIQALFQFIVDHYQTKESRWLFSLDDQLNVLDKQSDAYTLAFVLFSFSHYYQLTQDQQALHYITQTHDFLEQYMRHPKGGYYEAYPIDHQATRRQNPHMHLLEGYVAIYQATKDKQYLANIRELCDLAHDHFFDQKSTTLREFFNADLTPDAQTGHLVEPGHHFEWAWLLYQTYALTQRKQDIQLASKLWSSAVAYGLADNDGIVNSFDGNTGQVVDGDKRIWPITEYLKACCVVKMDESERLQRLDAALCFLEEHYFIDQGRWIEYLDAQNQSKGYPLPGTTSYHIFLSLAEVLKWRHSHT